MLCTGVEKAPTLGLNLQNMVLGRRILYYQISAASDRGDGNKATAKSQHFQPKQPATDVKDLEK